MFNDVNNLLGVSPLGFDPFTPRHVSPVDRFYETTSSLLRLHQAGTISTDHLRSAIAGEVSDLTIGTLHRVFEGEPYK